MYEVYRESSLQTKKSCTKCCRAEIQRIQSVDRRRRFREGLRIMGPISFFVSGGETVRTSGSTECLCKQGQRFAALPMLNGCHDRPGRKLMPASTSYIASRLLPQCKCRDSAGRRIMNPLCAERRFYGAFFARFHVPPLFLSLRHAACPRSPVRRCTPRSCDRHLMKCHRCPTDCQAKCRRLPIPRLAATCAAPRHAISTLRGMPRR